RLQQIFVRLQSLMELSVNVKLESFVVVCTISDWPWYAWSILDSVLKRIWCCLMQRDYVCEHSLPRGSLLLWQKN
ncbi:hypothetical protein HDU99_005137, partial [Rhizoclosmatium hyalinum]